MTGWSHGDAAMASIDGRDLDAYLVPRTPQPVTVEGLHALGRGVAHTRAPFAYLFERIA